MTDVPLRLHATSYSHPLHKGFFYPTAGSAQYRPVPDQDKEPTLAAHTESLEYDSRRARKGRYALRTRQIQHRPDAPEKASTEPADVTLRLRADKARSELKPHLKLDITFWLAVTFLLGSSVWVVNGEITRRNSSQSACSESNRLVCHQGLPSFFPSTWTTSRTRYRSTRRISRPLPAWRSLAESSLRSGVG